MQNKWERFLLSKKQVLKLEIFSMFVKENHITLLMVEEKFNITKRVAKSLLKELSEEINDVEGNETFQLIHRDHNYYIGPIFDSIIYSNTYYTIRTNYYQNSSLFLVMMYILEKRKSSVAEISNELVYSQSYSYKLVDSINEFLEDMEVQVTIQKNDNGIELVGVETEIRLMHYYCCIFGYSTFEWPFQSFTQSKIEVLQNFTNYMRDRVFSKNSKIKRSIIDSIYMMAIEKGKKTERFDDASLEIFSLLKDGIQLKSLINYMKNNTSLNEHDIEYELCNLLFLVNHILPEYLTMEEKIILGAKFSELKNNKVVDLALKALDVLPEFSFVSLESKNYFIFELVVRAITFKYFSMWKFSLEFSMKEFPLEIQRESFNQLSEIYSEYLESDSLNYYVRRIVEISSPFVLFKYGSSIKVYTEFTYKPHFKLILESTILFSYKENAIEIVHDINDADVVISDSYPNVEDIEYFYFSDIYVKQNWEELNSFLQKKMLQRGFKPV
ncbi:helix-turn-helix domain-containing protein [Vagococcus fluvialis]|uniref:helix-turn-helix domain-containing protein n=1 Tax=Vagococcus fluvialis TaxID=2738 RepID=UPI001D0A3BEC|nr:helix-turn-helix domain-containing protein [Vagococcus fluvialis]UDM73008.1 helix-turn-helix domain-containing protein [Vagococcus fluvialis]WNF89281.1 helix-turn-helix domain-containing protein [Vagococcus fluvialis]